MLWFIMVPLTALHRFLEKATFPNEDVTLSRKYLRKCLRSWFPVYRVAYSGEVEEQTKGYSHILITRWTHFHEEFHISSIHLFLEWCKLTQLVEKLIKLGYCLAHDSYSINGGD